jgi:fatty acid desaturase
MTTREDFNHQVRRTTVMTLALAACLIFGIVVLASSDWIPGGIIVAASGVALAKEIPVIRRLCSTDVPPATPKVH